MRQKLKKSFAKKGKIAKLLQTNWSNKKIEVKLKYLRTL